MPNQQSFEQLLSMLMNPELDSFLFNGLLKIMFLIGFGLYIFFALMVVRQVFMMIKTIETPIAPFLKIFSLAYLGLSVVVFLFVLMI